LVVHRVLFEKAAHTAATLKEVADHISTTERNSADAERDSREVKLYAHLTAQLKSGKRTSYPALVTDVRNFGFNVEVPTLGLSGLVHLSSMQDDFFVLDPVQSRLVGRSTRRVIKLGDNLTVQVCRVDPFKKQVDFQVAGSGPQTRPTPSRGGRDSRRPGAERGRGSRRPGAEGGGNTKRHAAEGGQKRRTHGGPQRKSR
jgi:ribonuclease R